MSTQTVAPTGCCPPFDPAPWQDKEIVWQGKPFLVDRYASFFYVPLNIGKVITRNMAKIVGAGAEPDVQLMLVDEKSPWRADIYIHVSRPVPDARMTQLSGTYLTKVFEGPYKNVGKWIREMKAFVAARGKTFDRLYTSYTTCPACAKAYGKNYVVLFAHETGTAPSGKSADA